MAKAYTFTTKHYPVNDLLALDLQDHLEQMAKVGWGPQMMFFWGKDEGS